MVYGRSHLVALAVGGGGAIVAAAVLGYFIKRYRDSVKSTISVDDADTAASVCEDSHAPSSDRLPSSKESSRKSSEISSTPSEGDDDFRSTLLERPLDFARISRSSGIAEVESPSFDDLLAIEDEVFGDLVEEISSEPDAAAFEVIHAISDEPDVEKLPPTKTEDSHDYDFNLHDSSEGAIAKKGISADFDEKREKSKTTASLSEMGGDSDFTRAALDFNRYPLPAIVTENSTSSVSLLPAVVTENSYERKFLPTPDSPSSISPPSRASSRASSSTSRCSTTLDDIEEQTTVLSPSESRALVGFLNSGNPEVIRRALLIAANAADFPANRYFLRRAGCIPVLNRYLASSSDDLIALSEKALGNLAVDDANLEYMVDSVVPLIKNARREDDFSIRFEAFRALRNLSRKALHHRALTSFVDELLGHVDDSSLDFDLRLETLKILANLSVDATVAPAVLSSRALTGLTKWLALAPTGKPQRDASEMSIALGVCDFLSNLLETAFPAESQSSWVPETLLVAVEREDTLLGSVASEVKAVTIRSLLFDLNRHPEPDVRFQGKRLYALLAALWRKVKSTSGKIIEEEN